MVCDILAELGVEQDVRRPEHCGKDVCCGEERTQDQPQTCHSLTVLQGKLTMQPIRDDEARLR